MPRISPVDPTLVDGQATKILAEIEAAFGRIPNLFKTYAQYPPYWRQIGSKSSK